MGHLSIAIIKKIVGDANHKEPSHSYLVIKQGNEYRFFDAKSLAIGSRFNFSGFQHHIVNTLGLSDSDFVGVRPFRSSRDEDATAYEYLLSDEQTKTVEEKIEKGLESHKNLLWLSESELLAQKDCWKKTQAFIFEKEKPFSRSTFSKDLRASLRNLVKARSNGKLVIFAGAGVSIDSGVPGWDKLIADLKTDISSENSDYLQVGELYYLQRGNKEYQERVREILKVGKTKFNAIHKKILEIRPIHVITTNFDCHFEQLIEAENFRYSVIKKDADLPYSKGNSLFIKMHGDFLEKNIVLKSSDYDEYAKNFPLIESYIKGLFSSKLVLFIGFSFTDPNLKQILKSVKDILGKDNQQPYLLNVKNEPLASGERTLIEQHVKILDFEDEAIEEYLGPPPIKGEKDSLNSIPSVPGKRSYKFLRVIESFDIVADSMENLPVEDQLVYSLNRFKGLYSIPPKAFEAISPFSLKKQSLFDFAGKASYSDDYSCHLETLNEELLTFLKSKQEDGKIKFNRSENDLDRILRFIYVSGIHCIIRKNDTSPSHNKLIPPKGEKCECFRCYYGNFKFSDLLKGLLSAENELICRNGSESLSLIEAYGFFKMSQPVKAYYALEKLKNEAQTVQNFVVYFLAIYNQQLLLPFLHWYYDSQVEQDELEQIRYWIKQINIDKVLSDLPLDDEVRVVLKSISNNKIYEESKSEIDQNLSKIKEVYIGYSDGEYFRSSGPVYWQNIETTFFVLHNFYHSNFLYNDEYDYFKNLSKLYLESIIASHATSTEYPQHIVSFSRLFFTTFIFHGNPKENYAMLREYNIAKIDFSNNDENREFLMKSFGHFVDSGYIENNFMGRTIEKNELMETALTRSSHLQKKTKDIFNNFLILLCTIDLRDQELSSVIQRTLNYLSMSSIFSGHSELEFFEKFVIHYVSKFDNEIIVKIIEFSLSDNIWSDKLIGGIAQKLIENNKALGSLDDKIYNKMIRRTEHRPKWTVRLQDMFPLYPLYKLEQQNKFKSQLVELLETGKFTTDHIRRAYYHKVWEPKKGDPFYEYFCKNAISGIANIPDFEVNDNGMPRELSSFSNFNDAVFAATIIYSHDLISSEFCQNLKKKVVAKVFRWVFSPADFDYNRFDARWLLLFSHKAVLPKMRNNIELKNAIEDSLRKKFNKEVAKIYFDVFCNSNLI